MKICEDSSSELPTNKLWKTFNNSKYTGKASFHYFKISYSFINKLCTVRTIAMLRLPTLLLSSNQLIITKFKGLVNEQQQIENKIDWEFIRLAWQNRMPSHHHNVWPLQILNSYVLFLLSVKKVVNFNNYYFYLVIIKIN